MTEINILSSPTNVNCGEQFTITVIGQIEVVGGYSVCIEKVNTIDTNYFFERGGDRFFKRICLPGNCTFVGQGFEIDFNKISLNSVDGTGALIELKATITDSAPKVTSNPAGTNQTINLTCP
jgi:hypothetical protein